MERIIKTDTLLDIYDTTSLDRLIDDLLKVKADSLDTYDHIYISIVTEDEDTSTVSIEGTRHETNDEYAKRLQYNKDYEERRKENEKKQLLELLKKYPDLKDEIINGK